MSSQGIVSNKEASGNSGMCLVKEQKSSVSSWTGAQNQFSNLVFPHKIYLESHIAVNRR